MIASELYFCKLIAILGIRVVLIVHIFLEVKAGHNYLGVVGAEESIYEEHSCNCRFEWRYGGDSRYAGAAL